jgi:antitoxin Phd
MNVNTNRLISMKEANQNFSKVARQVKEHGQIVLIKNNKPTFVLSLIEEYLPLTEQERIRIIFNRIFDQYKEALNGLSK